jgi:carboxymethylenebutenolidase
MLFHAFGSSLSQAFDVQSEMASFDGATGKVDAYLSKPKDSGKKKPALIVIHEIFGLDEHIKDVTNRFASQGYVSFAPHLFSRAGLKEILTVDNIRASIGFMRSLPPEKIRDRSLAEEELAKIPDENKRNNIGRTFGILFGGGLPRESLVEDLVHSVDFLNQKDYVKEGKIGSVGFCFGGTMSGALACKGKTAACVVFYGENPNPIEQVENIAGPFLGLYGGDDQRINSNLDKLVKAMVTYKKDFGMRIFPGAPHAFFNDTSLQTYRPQAAREAWEMVLRFFSRTISD